MQDRNDEEPSQPQDQQHPTATEPQEQAPNAGRRRLAHKPLCAPAALAMAAVVAVILTASSSGGSRVSLARAQSNTEKQRIDALLAGIPQSGSALGSPTAPVTLQFFGDLECSTSRAFTLVVLPSLISRWVRRGRLRIEYRSLQTATREPAVFIDEQAAALAAGTQAKAWYYIELFYHEQGHEDTGYVTTAFLEHLAGQIPGLNVALWSKDREEPSLAARVASDEQTAARLGLRNTPALLVGRTASNHASKVPSFLLREPTKLYEAVEGALRDASPSHTSATTASATTSRRSSADWRGGPSAAHNHGSAQC